MIRASGLSNPSVYTERYLCEVSGSIPDWAHSMNDFLLFVLHSFFFVCFIFFLLYLVGLLLFFTSASVLFVLFYFASSFLYTFVERAVELTCQQLPSAINSYSVLTMCNIDSILLCRDQFVHQSVSSGLDPCTGSSPYWIYSVEPTVVPASTINTNIQSSHDWQLTVATAITAKHELIY